MHPKKQGFELRSLPPLPPEKPKSQAARDREAKAYWDSLTTDQEIWALRKIGFFERGLPRPVGTKHRRTHR